ncbi:RHS repeat-associated core domain-containing protein [Treponema pedis]|nr:hypothetical protein [Treponema pedis]QSI03493.1 RHS repeat-associated core domain-containing protein [Treponema pedis]
MKTRCLLKKSNYLFWTAIEAVHAVRQSRTSSPILFAVCLSKKQALTGGKSLACEDKSSKKIGAVLVQQADRRSFEASAVSSTSVLPCTDVDSKFCLCKTCKLELPLSMAEVILVYFYITMMDKYRQSAAESCLRTFQLRVLPFGKTSGVKFLNLLNSPTDRTFENRRGKYKETGKKVPQAYRVYVEDTFLPCDAVIACIFSKEETGLYYYGARYLDPKCSRWLSGAPALNDYIPQAPIDDEAKKHNENLPGMGGIYNTVNLHVYHYAGNNPIKYIDPDDRDIILLNQSVALDIGRFSFGHNAVLVENDKDGWGYYSKENPLSNVRIDAATLADFIKENKKLLSKYDKGWRVTTDSNTDKKMKAYGDKNYSKITL